jgi:hypothetical protein
MFLQAEIGTAPAAEEENAEQLLFLSCLCSEGRSRVPLVTMSHPCLEPFHRVYHWV